MIALRVETRCLSANHSLFCTMKYLVTLFALVLLAACATDYVGMTVVEAETKAIADGVPFRIIMRDGIENAVTMDYRPGRINAKVENHIVTSYTVEGEDDIPPTKPMEEDANQSDYVGLTVTQAETQAAGEGIPFRVVMRDGESLPVTMDYRLGRINATVENDIVTSYIVEGNE